MPDYAETLPERLVREAMERGEFDALPGAGQPLRMRHLGDPDWWIKSKLEDEDFQQDLDNERPFIRKQLLVDRTTLRVPALRAASGIVLPDFSAIPEAGA